MNEVHIDKQREKRIAFLETKPSGSLLIHEIYRSIQGESTYAGLPCVFVRTTGCPARCSWCDTAHAFYWGTVKKIDDIISEVMAFNCPLVEITGGEPLSQKETIPLMARLADLGLTVLLETSGTVALDEVDPRVRVIMDLKCPASGECLNNKWSNLGVLKSLDEIKFVVACKADFEWAANIIRHHSLDKRFQLLVSGVTGKVEPKKLAEWTLNSGLSMRMQLQLHKYIWNENEKGV